jgi:hypothetical protein
MNNRNIPPKRKTIRPASVAKKDVKNVFIAFNLAPSPPTASEKQGDGMGGFSARDLTWSAGASQIISLAGPV